MQAQHLPTATQAACAPATQRAHGWRACAAPPGTTSPVSVLLPSFRVSTAVRARPSSAGEVPRLDAALDDRLSQRPLELDPAGYFIIRIDPVQGQLVAEHYANIINKAGLACDPATGEPIPCTPGYVAPPSRVYRGRTAKEVAVAILEPGALGAAWDGSAARAAVPVTRLEHAAYLGRELQRAELALATGGEYIQD